MGDKKPISITGTCYVNDKPWCGITYTEDAIVDEMLSNKLKDSAEFSCEIILPPRALTKLFGWKWYFKWHFNRVLNKIRKLITKAKIKRAYRRCYNQMENAGIAVFGMCAGLLFENGVKGATDLCLACPYFREVEGKNNV